MKLHAPGLPVAIDLEGQQVLLVGEGEEADRKHAACMAAGATVSRVSSFDAAALDGKRLVLVCVSDAQLAAQVHAAARARAVWCWACDDPEHSDLAMPAVARLGPALAAFSTSGHAPALSSSLRRAFEAGLGERFAGFVVALGEERERLRREEPDEEKRRARLLQLLDGFAVEITARYPDWFKS